MRLTALLALLLLAEIVTVWGGLWLVMTLARDDDTLAAGAVFVAMVPLSAWLGDRILKAFSRP